MCCGSGDKACGICGNADGNCLASLHDDFFFKATKEQVEKRLAEGRYACDKELMEEYVKTAKERPSLERSLCLITVSSSILESDRENYNPYNGKNDIRYYGFESHRNSE